MGQLGGMAPAQRELLRRFGQTGSLWAGKGVDILCSC